jgi:orotate phosphoribosyltransferase-like protein
LFKSGHYRLDAFHSVRDWIDLDGLFRYEVRYKTYWNKFPGNDENRRAVGNYSLDSEIFSDDDLKNIIKPKKTIIGINHYGAILAALLGYKYGKPFAYLFDSGKFVDAIEKEINSIEKDGILFIIDVVVFGDTLCKVLDVMLEKGVLDENSKIDVLILFERRYKKYGKPDEKYELSKIYSRKIIHKVYVINDRFNIELCNKSRNECLFIEGCRDDSCKNERNN